MLKLAPHEQKKLLQVCKGKKSISAKEYREALFGQKAKKTTNAKRVFSFVAKFIKHTQDVYELTIEGKHLSNNSILSLNFKDRLRYKKIIRQAVLDAGLIQKRLLPKKNIYAVLAPTAYNPRSRDDDSNSLTLKYVRDAIVLLDFAEDDSRKYLKEEKCKEILAQEWKLSILITTSKDKSIL